MLLYTKPYGRHESSPDTEEMQKLDRSRAWSLSHLVRARVWCALSGFVCKGNIKSNDPTITACISSTRAPVHPSNLSEALHFDVMKEKRTSHRSSQTVGGRADQPWSQLAFMSCFMEDDTDPRK